MWAAVFATSLGSYLIKLTGLSLPQQLLDRPRVRRLAVFLPVALLAALTAVQVLGAGRGLALDARVAGVAFAVVALRLRAPFIVVVVGAAAVAAGVRALLG
jgi:branched-subunit amino acid transport protein